jgi:redox-sensitive bicupin YhaK (pirin superfamily)
MGNEEILKAGDLQMTSAGTGIRHSEYNRNPKKPVHFLQVRVARLLD